MGAGLEECLVGHPASVTVVTRDKSGGACKNGNAILSAEVCPSGGGPCEGPPEHSVSLLRPLQVFTPDGSIVDGEMVDHQNGTYEFVYVIPEEGDFSLALRLHHQHIKGSPFRLKVSRVAQVEVRGAQAPPPTPQPRLTPDPRFLRLHVFRCRPPPR